MELKYKQAESRAELEQILKLQRTNLPENLSPDEKRSQGFVTVRHTLELLEQMNSVCGHIIAMDQVKLAGYALCMHPAFSGDIPVLQPMFAQLKLLLPRQARFMVMGQVCVAKPYRGKGVFRELYANMCHFLQEDFEWIITEVDASNTRSLKAHAAIGFKGICSYNSGGQNWEVIRLATSGTPSFTPGR
jgi:ribosomal protein S18 acetylase RimI-like enzyme